MKTYPLTIRCGDDDGQACYSKGHHDPEAFKAAAREWYREWHDKDMQALGEPMQTWWRAVPSIDGEHRCYYHPATPGSRGAFPVTLMEFR